MECLEDIGAEDDADDDGAEKGAPVAAHADETQRNRVHTIVLHHVLISRLRNKKKY